MLKPIACIQRFWRRQHPLLLARRALQTAFDARWNGYVASLKAKREDVGELFALLALLRLICRRPGHFDQSRLLRVCAAVLSTRTTAAAADEKTREERGAAAACSPPACFYPLFLLPGVSSADEEKRPQRSREEMLSHLASLQAFSGLILQHCRAVAAQTVASTCLAHVDDGAAGSAAEKGARRTSDLMLPTFPRTTLQAVTLMVKTLSASLDSRVWLSRVGGTAADPRQLSATTDLQAQGEADKRLKNRVATMYWSTQPPLHNPSADSPSRTRREPALFSAVFLRQQLWHSLLPLARLLACAASCRPERKDVPASQREQAVFAALTRSVLGLLLRGLAPDAPSHMSALCLDLVAQHVIPDSFLLAHVEQCPEFMSYRARCCSSEVDRWKGFYNLAAPALVRAVASAAERRSNCAAAVVPGLCSVASAARLGGSFDVFRPAPAASVAQQDDVPARDLAEFIALLTQLVRAFTVPFLHALTAEPMKPTAAAAGEVKQRSSLPDLEKVLTAAAFGCVFPEATARGSAGDVGVGGVSGTTVEPVLRFFQPAFWAWLCSRVVRYANRPNLSHMRKRLLASMAQFYHACLDLFGARLAQRAYTRAWRGGRQMKTDLLAFLAFSAPHLLECVWDTLTLSVGVPLSSSMSAPGSSEIKSAEKSGWSLFRRKKKAPSVASTMVVEPYSVLEWVEALNAGVSSTGMSDNDLFRVVFRLFLELLQIRLSIEEDGDFRARHRPFRLFQEVPLFCRVLRLFVFEHMWTQRWDEPVRDSSLSPRPEDLVDPCSTVLRLLHARDRRLRFFRELSWLQKAEEEERAGLRAAEEDKSSPASGPGSMPKKQPTPRQKKPKRGGGTSFDQKASVKATGDNVEADWVIERPGDREWQDVLTALSTNLDSLDEKSMGRVSMGLQRLMRVLWKLPFVCPFLQRASVFRFFCSSDRDSRAHFTHSIRVRRDHLVADGFGAVAQLGAEFRERIQVKFVGADGREEKGIDLGGPMKELIESMLQGVVRKEYGLFSTTPDGHCYPNPANPALSDFRCVGRLIGKAIFEGILTQIPFAIHFLDKLLGKLSSFEDLRLLDPVLYKNLLFLKHYDGDSTDLCLNFAIGADDCSFDGTGVVELRPNGGEIEVNNSNRVEYIYLVAHHHLNRKIEKQSAAFASGLHDVIQHSWLSLFDAAELRLLIGGARGVDIDVADWAAHCVYENCKRSDAIVKWFWQIVSTLDPPDKEKLLQFATGCSRPPLLGFVHLSPPFCIRLLPNRAKGVSLGSKLAFWKKSKPDKSKLLTSATCFNMLKIPLYKSKAVLASKLKLAIQEARGFHLA